MKKKLLFINQSQFGYHIDYVQYCKYLKEYYDITYLCWDYNKEKIKERDINILYVSRRGNIVIRNFRFIQYVLKYLKHQDFSFVFIHYFRGSSFIRLLTNNKMWLHLDIRTGCVSNSIITRNIYNSILRIESLFFKSISIISVGLRNKLQIHKNACILPLGATKMNIKRLSRHIIHLLYVGTFSNRQLEVTIDGLSLFLKEEPLVDIHYTIIGDGWKNEKNELENRIKKHDLEKYIDLKGYVPFNELMQYYEKANVGVSYIPITPYYEYQPATKTFEYLMVGMPVIATQTFENAKIINQNNGVLINDNATSFANGINHIYNSLDFYDEQKIKKTVEAYEWSRIIQKMKEEILR